MSKLCVSCRRYATPDARDRLLLTLLRRKVRGNVFSHLKCQKTISSRLLLAQSVLGTIFGEGDDEIYGGVKALMLSMNKRRSRAGGTRTATVAPGAKPGALGSTPTSFRVKEIPVATLAPAAVAASAAAVPIHDANGQLVPVAPMDAPPLPTAHAAKDDSLPDLKPKSDWEGGDLMFRRPENVEELKRRHERCALLSPCPPPRLRGWLCSRARLSVHARMRTQHGWRDHDSARARLQAPTQAPPGHLQCVQPQCARAHLATRWRRHCTAACAVTPTRTRADRSPLLPPPAAPRADTVAENGVPHKCVPCHLRRTLPRLETTQQPFHGGKAL